MEGKHGNGYLSLSKDLPAPSFKTLTQLTKQARGVLRNVRRQAFLLVRQQLQWDGSLASIGVLFDALGSVVPENILLQTGE